MLNIIAKKLDKVSGPNKVINNLIKGLRKINYPFVINHEINATRRCYIPKNKDALEYLGKARSRVVVGPNLYVLPDRIPGYLKPGLASTLYVHPCTWTIELWKQLGYNLDNLYPWPTGIDLDEFPARDTPVTGKGEILLYHKTRSPRELETIQETLDRLGLRYRLIVYGEYRQDEYLDALRKAPFVLWHGRHESQGIALQEALASNVPILVADVRSLMEEQGSNWPESLRGFEVTAAPYFDERCGIKIRDISNLPETIEQMQDGLQTFAPREFIAENLGLEKQARDFIDLWNHWGMSFEDGMQEQMISDRPYRPRRITFRKLLAKIGKTRSRAGTVK